MKFDLLLEASAWMIGFYLVTKAVAPYLSELFGTTKKKTSSAQELDSMIQRKVQQLRVEGLGTTQESQTNSGKQKTQKQKVDFAELVKAKFVELSKQSQKTEQTKMKIDELKKYMSLLDALQWGQSEDISTLRRRFEKHFDFAPDDQIFLRSIRLVLIHANLINERGHPIDFDEFCEYICVSVANDIIRQSFVAEDSKDAITLTKRWHVNLRHLKSSWLFWLFDQVKLSSPDFFKLILSQDLVLNGSKIQEFYGIGPDSLPWDKIISQQHKARKVEDFVSSFRESLATLQSITPLAKSEPMTRKEALHIMGFETLPAPGVLSRRYKKLARFMHPDTIISKGFPTLVMDQVNENFRTLKAGYELLKEEATKEE